MMCTHVLSALPLCLQRLWLTRPGRRRNIAWLLYFPHRLGLLLCLENTAVIAGNVLACLYVYKTLLLLRTMSWLVSMSVKHCCYYGQWLVAMSGKHCCYYGQWLVAMSGKHCCYYGQWLVAMSGKHCCYYRQCLGLSLCLENTVVITGIVLAFRYVWKTLLLIRAMSVGSSISRSVF